MKTPTKQAEGDERQYWLWVTKPEYYLDEDGSERIDLEPSSGMDTEGWWTCHKDTKQGDFVFIWRTSPRSDIGYLFQASSDAISIAKDDYAAERGWSYGCEYLPLYKFKNPLHISEIRDTACLDDWNAFRGKFQGKVFRISPEFWKRLNDIIAKKENGYVKFLKTIMNIKVDRQIVLEEELENELVENLDLLKPFGFNLKLYVDPKTAATGRQYVCASLGGRIDLLCYDIKSKKYVVIELKNVRAGQNTFGQISSYVGWVSKNISKASNVTGLVISRGFDTKFESALETSQNIQHLNISELGFS